MYRKESASAGAYCHPRHPSLGLNFLVVRPRRTQANITRCSSCWISRGMRSPMTSQQQWDAGLARVQKRSFCLITTVNGHWAFLPASARSTNPVMLRGTGMTVLTYWHMHFSQFSSLFRFSFRVFYLCMVCYKTQVPENG